MGVILSALLFTNSSLILIESQPSTFYLEIYLANAYLHGFNHN
jgi:hypothetical protein